jgi:aspartate/methionine/tyrosine aminotransferase
MRKSQFIQNLETSPKTPLMDGYRRILANPNAIINIGTAESKLMNDWLLPKITDMSDFKVDYFSYMGGDYSSFMADMASFYREYLGITDAKPEQIIPGIGIAFLVERISLVLCNPGEIVLIPKPCYGFFEPDMKPSYCVVQYIDLDNLPPSPPENARMLLLTNPGNPYGDIIPDQDKLLKWALSNPNLHVVTDDVYALSNRRGENYQSIAGRSDIDPMRVHEFYGLSKDWGLAGFHVGFFFTRNSELMEYMVKARTCSSMSADVIYQSHKLFKDHKWRDDYIVEYRKRLIKAEEYTMSKLKENGIPAKQYDNSLFIMVDLTDIAGTDEKEVEVYLRLIDEYQVHILPGKAGFRCEKPGWFRLCFSMSDDILIPGVEKLIKGVLEMRKELQK